MVNHSARGVLVSRGSLNTNINGNRQLNGVFVSGGTSNLNLSGTPEFKGLYYLASNSSLSFNMNGNASFEGAMWTSGTTNINRNGNTRLVYDPNQVMAWQSDLGIAGGMLCAQGNKPYTQNIALVCSTPIPDSNGSLKMDDALYHLAQTLTPSADGSWYKMSGRPLPVPDTWFSVDKGEYILSFLNTGLPQISTRWVSSREVSFPAGMKQIGLAGGTIELPGVAKLEIPANALSSAKIIKITQILEAPSRAARFEPNPNDASSYYHLPYGFDYASPVVKIEPFGLRLNVSGKVTLPLFKEAYKNLTAYPANLVTQDINDLQNGVDSGWEKDPFKPIEVRNLGFYGKLLASSMLDLL